MLDIKQIQKNIEKLKKMTPKQWDSVCKNCGLCCLAKVEEDDGKIYYSNFACKHFDIKTKKCNCYDNRLSQSNSENCAKLDLKHILEGKLIPDSCAYVEKIFGKAKYPAIMDWAKVQNIDSLDDKNLAKIIDNIIPSSVFWATRYNLCDDFSTEYADVKTTVFKYISDN